MNSYLIFKPGSSHAEERQAEAMSIEPSGALVLYGLDAAGDKKDVIYAYAPACWKTAEKVIKHA